MTAVLMNRGTAPRRTLIEDAIAEHGAMRVLISAGRALFRTRRLRRERPPDIRFLTTRMRRDIGLLPELDAPEQRPIVTDWRYFH